MRMNSKEMMNIEGGSVVGLVVAGLIVVGTVVDAIFDLGWLDTLADGAKSLIKEIKGWFKK